MSMSQQLRDAGGKQIGQLLETGPTRMTLQNNAGKIMGWYDSKFNMTFDATGKIFSKGNLLMALLKN